MENSKVVIIDYGMGNVGSIQNMLKHVGVPAIISKTSEDVETADKLIIAGVGAFDAGISSITALDVFPVINERVLVRKVPILGICLGMQLFTKSSEEGKLPGLCWFNAETKRFDISNLSEKLRVPHMGWNTAKVSKSSKLVKDLPEDSRFYFVHSFHCVCNDKSDELLSTHYGYDFASAIERENVYGVQFHPEKSHKFGMKILENFARLV